MDGSGITLGDIFPPFTLRVKCTILPHPFCLIETTITSAESNSIYCLALKFEFVNLTGRFKGHRYTK